MYSIDSIYMFFFLVFLWGGETLRACQDRVRQLQRQVKW